MGEHLKLNAEIGAYLARPAGTPKAGVVVIQEIFGVNNHIRNVTDRFARDGYLALAPQYFDRIRPKIELGYTPDGIAEGRTHVMAVGQEKAVADTADAIAKLRELGAKKVGTVGFCWGGTIVWLSATRLTPDAAVGYYGGGIHAARTEKPKVPTLLHFGQRDAHIPMTQVEEVRALHPGVTVLDYPADHGFHCDERGSYDEPSAKLAYARTLEFFAKHLA
jgi:carboxymethylenebutenolidase